jgi:hypothetical protein
VLNFGEFLSAAKLDANETEAFTPNLPQSSFSWSWQRVPMNPVGQLHVQLAGAARVPPFEHGVHVSQLVPFEP